MNKLTTCVESIIEARLKQICEKMRLEEDFTQEIFTENRAFAESVGRRKKRDPNAPKLPPNGFMRYSKVKREELKVKNPELKGAAITKRLGEMWRNEAQPVKDKYNKEYEVAKQQMGFQSKAELAARA